MIRLRGMQKMNSSLITFLLLLTIGSDLRAQNFWQELSSSGTTRDLRRLVFLDSTRGWVSGAEGALLKTTNGGTTWQELESGTPNEIHELFMLNDRLGWALSWSHFVDTLTWYGTNILSTTNGGTSWRIAQYPAIAEFFSAVVFHDSLNGVMGGEFGLLVHTTNGGATWVPAVVDSSLYAHWSIRRMRFHTRNYGYAMGGRLDIVGVVWRTTDGGLRWTADGVSPEPVRDMHFVDSNKIVAVAGDLDYGASTLITKNGGAIWEYTFLQIFGEPSALAFRTPAEGWAPLGFAGFFMMTRDTGRTWKLVETPRRKSIYDVTFTDSLTGYAVGDSGTILKFRTSTLSVEEIPTSAPASFALHHNYPNPFNPSTTITFDLPEASDVSLGIYDVLGQRVAELAEGRYEIGRHSVSWNGGSVGSGVYFARFIAHQTVEVRKVMKLLLAK